MADHRDVKSEMDDSPSQQEGSPYRVFQPEMVKVETGATDWKGFKWLADQPIPQLPPTEEESIITYLEDQDSNDQDCWSEAVMGEQIAYQGATNSYKPKKLSLLSQEERNAYSAIRKTINQMSMNALFEFLEEAGRTFVKRCLGHLQNHKIFFLLVLASAKYALKKAQLQSFINWVTAKISSKMGMERDSRTMRVSSAYLSACLKALQIYFSEHSNVGFEKYQTAQFTVNLTVKIIYRSINTISKDRIESFASQALRRTERKLIKRDFLAGEERDSVQASEAKRKRFAEYPSSRSHPLLITMRSSANGYLFGYQQ